MKKFYLLIFLIIGFLFILFNNSNSNLAKAGSTCTPSTVSQYYTDIYLDYNDYYFNEYPEKFTLIDGITNDNSLINSPLLFLSHSYYNDLGTVSSNCDVLEASVTDNLLASYSQIDVDYYRFVIDGGYNATINLKNIPSDENYILSLYKVNYLALNLPGERESVVEYNNLFPVIVTGNQTLSINNYLEPGMYAVEVSKSNIHAVEDDPFYNLIIHLEKVQHQDYEPVIVETPISYNHQDNIFNPEYPTWFPKDDLGIFKTLIPIESDQPITDYKLFTKEFPSITTENSLSFEVRVAMIKSHYTYNWNDNYFYTYGDDIFGSIENQSGKGVDPFYNEIKYFRFAVNISYPTDYSSDVISSNLNVSINVINSGTYQYNFDTNCIMLMNVNQGGLQIKDLFSIISIDNPLNTIEYGNDIYNPSNSILSNYSSDLLEKGILDYQNSVINPNVEIVTDYVSGKINDYANNKILELFVVVAGIDPIVLEILDSVEDVYNNINEYKEIFTKFIDAEENPFLINESRNVFKYDDNLEAQYIVLQQQDISLVQNNYATKNYDYEEINFNINRSKANLINEISLSLNFSVVFNQDDIMNYDGANDISVLSFSFNDTYIYHNNSNIYDNESPILTGVTQPITINLGNTLERQKLLEGVSVYDNYDGIIDQSNVQIDLDKFSSLEIGLKTIKYSVEDSAGNITEYLRVINVIDTLPPVLNFSNLEEDYPFYIYTNGDTIYINSDTLPMPTVTDNSGETIMAHLLNNADNQGFQLGEYQITYEAMDSSGNVGQSTKTVIVVDQNETNNSIQSATNIQFTHPVNEIYDVSTNYGTIHSVDDVDYYKFNVPHSEYVQIDLPDNNYDNFYTNYDIELYNQSNNLVGESHREPDVDYPHLADDTIFVYLPAGDYYVRVYSKDNEYYDADTSYSLTVKRLENQAPVVHLYGSQTMTVINGTQFTDPGYYVSDDNFVNEINVTQSIKNGGAIVSSINTNIITTYTITYTATDAEGLTSSITRTVIIKDTLPPVLNFTHLEDLYPNYIDSNGNTIYIIVDSEIPLPWVSDNSNSQITAQIINRSSYCSQLCEFQVTYKATDPSGNYSTAIKTIVTTDYYESNDTISTAQNVTLTSSTNPDYYRIGNFYGTIHSITDVDYYKVNVPSNSYITVELPDNSYDNFYTNYDIELYNQSNNLVGESHREPNPDYPHTADDAICVYLLAGDYYIKVYSRQNFDVDTLYTLTIKLANNVAPVINLIGDKDMLVKQNSSYVEPGYSINDWFSSKVTMQITYKNASDGTISTIPTSVIGMYKVVYLARDEGGLTSSVERIVRITDKYENGNTTSTAYSLGTYSTSNLSGTYSAYLNFNTYSNTKDVDFYLFTLSAAYTATITLENIPNNFNYDICIFKSTDLANPVVCSNNTSNQSELIDRLLNSGSYYIKVYSNGTTTSNDTAYTLKVNLNKYTTSGC